MTNLTFDETKFEGMNEEEIKGFLYNLYLNKVDVKKPLTALENARTYIKRVHSERIRARKGGYFDRYKVWDETKRQVREIYGVKNVGEIPETNLEEANEKAIQIINSLIN